MKARVKVDWKRWRREIEFAAAVITILTALYVFRQDEANREVLATNLRAELASPMAREDSAVLGHEVKRILSLLHDRELGTDGLSIEGVSLEMTELGGFVGTNVFMEGVAFECSSQVLDAKKLGEKGKAPLHREPCAKLRGSRFEATIANDTELSKVAGEA